MSKLVYNTNCNNYPSLPTILPSANRIIAIGDVHGDMKLVIDSLVISKVIIPSKTKINTVSAKLNNRIYYYEWIGGNTIVVQIGDQNDSCRPNLNGDCNHINYDTADDIPILIFFTKLHDLAIIKGGGVYSLLGNHELMNVNGDFKYTSNANINQFRKYKDPFTNKIYIGNPDENIKHAFKQGNEYANLMGCTRQSILIIGDFLFVHAGINKYFLENFRGRENLPRLNKLVKNWLLNKLNEISKDQELLSQLINHSDNSPFWNRILGQLPTHLSYNSRECKDLLAPIIEAYKIKGMIIGHTPQMGDGINSTCSNKLFRIDVAASKAFTERREPQVLEIKKLENGIYKYTVIFQKEEVYESIVPDDITSFGRMESRLPN